MKRFLVFVALIIGSALLLVACGTKQAKLEEIMKEITFQETVDKSFTMPKLDPKYEGVTLTFESSHPNVISTTGVVKQQNSEVSVTITAILTRGDEVLDKEFIIKVKALDFKELLAIALSQINLPAETTTDLSLPNLDVNDERFKDFVLKYESSNVDVLTNDGKVTRGATDVTVDMKVTVSHNETKLEKTLQVIVKAMEQTDEELVDAAMAKVLLPAEIESDLLLPAAKDGVQITWASNNVDVITNDGEVTRSTSEDITVILTATFKLNDVTKTKEYTVKVLKVPESEITAILENVSYTLTQEILDEEVNAVLNITGKAFISKDSESREVKLVFYYKDDTVLEIIDNVATETDGTFDVTVKINHKGIGWDWYKFAISVTEGEISRQVLIPYIDDQKVLAVLHGKDGSIREFITQENNGYLNIRTNDQNMDQEQITNKMKVLADYQRLQLEANLMLSTGDELPSNTGQYGQEVPIVWTTTSSDITITDNVVTVINSTDANSIPLIATLTLDDYTITKEFSAGSVGIEVDYTNLTAGFKVVDVTDSTDTNVVLEITGDVTSNMADAVYKLEFRIDKEGSEILLELFDNEATEEGKVKFTVMVSGDYDYQNEWAKFKLVTVNGEEVLKEEFPEEMTISTTDYYFAVNGESRKYFEVNYNWGFLYIRVVPQSEVGEKIGENTFQIVEEEGKVYLLVEGVLSHTSNMTAATIVLKLKDIEETSDNLYTGEEANHYQFKVEITNLQINDWVDIHVIFDFEKWPEPTMAHTHNFKASPEAKDKLNSTVAREFGDFRYEFEEWEHDLKIVRKNK